MNITAVVLTAGSYGREWQGLTVLVRNQCISSAKEQLEARFSAIRKVQTPHFFFLDDDDDLPDDYLDVLGECVAANVALAYTDEKVMTDMNAPVGSVLGRGPYSRREHYRCPTLVHHLALCRIEDALQVIDELPSGHFWPEFLLYWKLAQKSVAYIPRVGYIWNKRDGGLHDLPSTTLAQARGKLFVKPELGL